MKKAILLYVFLLGFNYANATIYYVKTSGADANNGTSWNTAYQTLQKALDVAVANDEIWVATGNYVPTKNMAGTAVANAADNTFYITKNIKLYGGFAGTETAIDQRIAGSNTTTLNGDFTNNGVDNDNAYNVIYMDATVTGNLNTNCVIDGFSIINGYPSGKPFSGGDFESGGGGIYVKVKDAVCSAKIENCIFRNNIHNSSGAAVYVKTTEGTNNLLLNKCIFPENQDNAVMFEFDGYSIFSFNTNPISGQVNITNCSFYKNKSPLRLICSGGNDRQMNITFNLRNSKFHETTNVGTGGPITLQANHSTLVLNTNIENCLFYLNSSTNGPGVILFTAQRGPTLNAKLVNNTFYKNTGTAAAGVVNHVNDDSSTMLTAVSNSIFYQNNLNVNSESQGSEVNATTGTANISVGYSMTQQNSSFSTGTGIINNQDPKFVDADNGDLRLRSGSPALNSGTSTGAPTTDFLGASRPQGGGIDMGAYEGVVTLPVNLTTFEASTKYQKQINLNWLTASEIDNNYFTIAKSQDGKTFNELATVKSKGNNGASYSTIDFQPFEGTSYYRLSQTDRDGRTAELGIRTVKLNSLREEGLSVYPNPIANGIIHIKSPNLKGAQNLIIYDLSGKELIKDQVLFSDENLSYQIGPKLAKGTYLLQIGESQKAIKMIVE